VLKSIKAFCGSVTIIFCPAKTSPCPLFGGIFIFWREIFEIRLYLYNNPWGNASGILTKAPCGTAVYACIIYIISSDNKKFKHFLKNL
jgi:hypothetical protein